MALGGNVLRQHVVEFIRGVGVVTDGVVAATSLNGPWNWQVPEGVAELTMDGCSAGGGGGGGWGSGTSRAGGGGGGSGTNVLDLRIRVLPMTTLTIALGAGGSAGGVGNSGSNGGATTISGFPVGAAFSYIAPTHGRIVFEPGFGGMAATATTGGSGNRSGNDWTNRIADGGGGSANALNPATPQGGTASWPGFDTSQVIPANILGFGGGGGGGASTDGAIAGRDGGGGVSGRTFMRWRSGGQGATDGSVSYGGGGAGGPSLFGSPSPDGVFRLGGSGNTVAPTGVGFGYGGSGGGGNAPGAPGGDGYVRFTYWSMD